MTSRLNPEQSQVTTGVDPRGPWWKEPMVWLVWGGPLAVVVASLVTVFIAVRFGDRPLTPGERASLGQGAAMTPAVQARNHAATQGARPDR